MSYLDTTLTPEAGYAAVNVRQSYDAIAAQMSANSAWTFVETVDWMSGSTTWRHWVWKCNAASSGLPNDYYVIFRAYFTTPGTVWTTNGGYALRVYLAEGYNTSTHTASKVAPATANSLTPNSDQSSPMTWVLSTTDPQSISLGYAAYGTIGPINSVTAQRLLISVTADTVQVWTGGTTTLQAYVGAIETLLSAADDPMPIIVACSNGGYTPMQYAGAWSTRHPKVPIASATYLFGFNSASWHAQNSPNNFAYGAILTMSGNGQSGVLGDPTSPYTGLFGTTFAGKCAISSSGGGAGINAATRGGIRGFYKNILGAACAAHSLGDTFQVDGKAYAGFGPVQTGATPMLDTTA